MVVISASVLTNNGSVLLSRQFVEISQSTIDGYLQTFPSMLNTRSEHTFVDQGNIRYVYQPVGSLYVVVLTPTNSNMFEDLEVVRTFGRILTYYCDPVDKPCVLKNCFKILYAFDEVVSLGYREPIDFDHINRSISMHSDNEMLADVFRSDQEKQAKEVLKRKAKEFEMIEKKKMSNSYSGSNNDAYSKFASFNARFNNLKKTILEASPFNITVDVNPHHSFMNVSTGFSSSNVSQSVPSSHRTHHSAESTRNVKSLSLGKTKVDKPVVNNSSVYVPVNHTEKKLKMTISEAASAKINRNGQLENYEINGILGVSIFDSAHANLQFSFDHSPSSFLSLQVHPNINKSLFHSENIIGIKEGGRCYPLNNEIVVLKWHHQSKRLEDLPLIVNNWVERSGSKEYTTIIELDLNKRNTTLYGVVITFPLDFNYMKEPKVVNISDGRYNITNKTFEWNIDCIDKNSPNLSIEILLADFTSSIESLYPIECSFKSNFHHLGCEICNVAFGSNNGNFPMSESEYEVETVFSTECYSVV